MNEKTAPPLEQVDSTPIDTQRAEVSLIIAKNYRQRLTYLKQGQDYFKKGAPAQGTQQYQLYLKAIADYHSIKTELLSPKNFTQKKDGTELLLLSQVFWDLAKFYDQVPSKKSPFNQYLNQFIQFSIDQPFQPVNYGNLKRFLKYGKPHHRKEYTEAYQAIAIKTGKCFVATFCYGENHPSTELLRQFRGVLMNYSLGKSFVLNYYHWSPVLVTKFEKLGPWQFPFKIICQIILFPLITILKSFQKK